MSGEVEMSGKEVVVDYLKTLSLRSPEESEKSYLKFNPNKWISG
jgi:hypothetical protein